METKLARIAEIARERPKDKFTSLAHLLNAEMLVTCHRELKSGRASSVDQQTKALYEENLMNFKEQVFKECRDTGNVALVARRHNISPNTVILVSVKERPLFFFLGQNICRKY